MVEKKFRNALKYLILNDKWETYSIEERKNKIKNLENKFYEEAINYLVRMKGNEELYKIVQNVRLVMEDINPQNR